MIRGTVTERRGVLRMLVRVSRVVCTGARRAPFFCKKLT